MIAFKPIKLKDALLYMISDIERNCEGERELYLIGDGKFHLISSVDLYKDRIQCEDEYWYCYSWILENEKSGFYNVYSKSED